jgi:acyl carrier protein
MADTDTLQSTITRIFVEKLLVEVQDPETDLIEAGLLDSLMFVDLLLHLERELQVAVTLDTLELDNFRSVRRIVEFIRASRSAAGGAAPDPAPIQTLPLAAGRTQTA